MSFSSQLRSSTESNKRSVETLEAKLTKMKAEWESSKLAHEATRAEFESYKVRYRVVGFLSFTQRNWFVNRRANNGKRKCLVLSSFRIGHLPCTQKKNNLPNETRTCLT